MWITIKRTTGWQASITKMQIIVNGKKVSKIENNQILEVKVPDSKNNLKVRLFGVGSNEIEVGDGDVVEVKYKGWYRALFPLMLAITFIMSNILFLPYNSTILPVHILFVIVSFVSKGFIIKKIDS